jgi:hypothetical protein
VRQLADIMHLKDWRIEVYEDAPGGADAIASCAPVGGRKLAVIRLGESFLTDSSIDQRHTLIHELLHCHLGPMQRMLEAGEPIPAAAMLAIEYAVDGLADVIAPLVPEPPSSTRSQA